MGDPAASRGQPSAIWRQGQDRRLALIAAQVPEGARLALDIGCGLGLYTERLATLCTAAIGIEVSWSRAQAARQQGLVVAGAVGEYLPFADASFDLVLLHEVLEHVTDDVAALREVSRVVAPGGRVMIFVPNRWWPFETHGIYWRGRYRFGNAPLVNYLPDPLRNQLAPHVRVYTTTSLAGLFRDLPLDVLTWHQVFPGYDKLSARRPRLGRWLRGLTYGLEATPLRRLGLSHFLVLERCAPSGQREAHLD